MINISIELLALLILTIVFVLMLCASVLSNRSSTKNTKNENKVLISNICTNCKVGEKSYKLDKSSESCPNIVYCQNGKCKYYKPIK